MHFAIQYSMQYSLQPIMRAISSPLINDTVSAVVLGIEEGTDKLFLCTFNKGHEFLIDRKWLERPVDFMLIPNIKWRTKVHMNSLYSADTYPNEPVLSIEMTEDGKLMIITSRTQLKLTWYDEICPPYFEDGTRRVVVNVKYIGNKHGPSEAIYCRGITAFESQGHAEFDKVAVFVAAGPVASA